jgi:hypothetical protein
MPVEGEDVSALMFQTKDTEMQYLCIYVITADGRLVHRRDDGTDEEIPYHGDIYFYWSNWCGSGQHGVMTGDNGPPDGRTCTARFTNGRVEWIRRDRDDEDWACGRPHLTRAEWHKAHNTSTPRQVEADGD